MQARTDHRIGPYNLLTVGYEYEREKYKERNTDADPDPATQIRNGVDIEQDGHTVFAQDQIRLLDGRLQMALSHASLLTKEIKVCFASLS